MSTGLKSFPPPYPDQNNGFLINTCVNYCDLIASFSLSEEYHYSELVLEKLGGTCNCFEINNVLGSSDGYCDPRAGGSLGLKSLFSTKSSVAETISRINF